MSPGNICGASPAPTSRSNVSGFAGALPIGPITPSPGCVPRRWVSRSRFDRATKMQRSGMPSRRPLSAAMPARAARVQGAVRAVNIRGVPSAYTRPRPALHSLGAQPRPRPPAPGCIAPQTDVDQRRSSNNPLLVEGGGRGLSLVAGGLAGAGLAPGRGRPRPRPPGPWRRPVGGRWQKPRRSVGVERRVRERRLAARGPVRTAWGARASLSDPVRSVVW
jgi:hypothetical protein